MVSTHHDLAMLIGAEFGVLTTNLMVLGLRDWV